MKICGLHSGHDCSFAILENGIPIVHHEKERFSRKKMVISDALEFVFNVYPDHNNIDYFIHNISTWKGGIGKRYEDTFKRAKNIANVDLTSVGHHQSHAANAFFSSNYENALIITVDGGGEDFADGVKNNHIISVFTVWLGKDNKIYPLKICNGKMTNSGNLGLFWTNYTSEVFGLSVGPPIGDQSGTVMAMAAYGNPNEISYKNKSFIQEINNKNKTFDYYKMLGDKNEKNKFHVAAAMQVYLEENMKKNINEYMEKYKPEVICLAGGTVLNSVMIGKFYEWYPNIKKIYIPPAPYDAGCAMGSAQWFWHDKLNNPRIKWENNFSPYLGYSYGEDEIKKTLNNNSDKIEYRFVNDDYVIELLSNQAIISVYGGRSETGRRALGNRSILADPRNPTMKDRVNKKVKHRQWFRPFAPSILREDVGEWFERDVDSPYMSIVIKFRNDKINKVPAVVHEDNSARLQTVTEKDNKWFYNFIKKWKNKTGIPILLNTSFNDREPIVETPYDAIKCFLGTEIDYLYFYEPKILVQRR